MDRSIGNGVTMSDAHCHLQDPRYHDVRESLLSSCVTQLGMVSIVANGTHPGDWPHVLALQRQYPDSILPQLGLHPWWVENSQSSSSSSSSSPSSDDWLDELRRLLVENPHAGLGECGLDKSGSRKHTFQQQCVAFEKQIHLALELNRPLSIHCVRAYGAMYDRVKDIGGRIPVMLHGWAGSPEMTRMFSQLDNVFFSLNLTIVKMDPNTCIRMVRSVPSDARLLESDGPDGGLDDIPEAAFNAWYDVFPSFKDDVEQYKTSSAVMRGINTPACVSLVGRLIALITGTSYDSIQARATSLVQQIFAHYLQ
ncbi:hypothetical protein M9434_000484 [Picochlorum sp. BPE23]|nr:hypothetical protein M9434_000484 [Picochlorum sp. BPE23]